MEGNRSLPLLQKKNVFIHENFAILRSLIFKCIKTLLIKYFVIILNNYNMKQGRTPPLTLVTSPQSASPKTERSGTPTHDAAPERELLVANQ